MKGGSEGREGREGRVSRGPSPRPLPSTGGGAELLHEARALLRQRRDLGRPPRVGGGRSNKNV